MDKGYKLSMSSSSLNDALLSAENTMGGNMAVKTDFDGPSPDRFGILSKDGLEPGYYKLGLRYWDGVGDSGGAVPVDGSTFSFRKLKSSNKVTAISCTLFSSSTSIYNEGQYVVDDATGLFPSNIKVAGKDKFTHNTELLIQSIYGIATVVERVVDRSTPTKFVYLIDNEEVEVEVNLNPELFMPTGEDLNNKDKLIKILVGTNASKFEKTFDVSAYCNLKEIHLPKTLEKIDIDFNSSVADLSSISGTILTDKVDIIYSGSEFEFDKFYYWDSIDPFITYNTDTYHTDIIGAAPYKMTFLNK